MTSNSPDEAIHFRGKTLTPESPRPLHIPEPSNIPVLKNQMDPVFNDTSTYENPSTSQDDEPSSQLGSDSETYKSANEEEHRIQAALLNMAQESGTVEDSTILYAQSAPAQVPLSTQPNTAPYNQMDVSTSAADTTLLDPSMTKPEIDVASINAPSATSVDFQNLLDNLTSSASLVPSGPAAPATTSPSADKVVIQENKPPQSSAIADHSQALSAGLPPRPPTQEMPSLNPNYLSTAHISDYHPLGTQASKPLYLPHAQSQDQNSNDTTVAPGVTSGASSGANGLPPPPLATFQQFQSQQKSVLAPDATVQPGHKSSRPERHSVRTGASPDDDVFWGDEVQKIYDEFLREERAYVTEGLWDRFPYGSRLFVGNLPSERVTKRDLFHVFHKYGKLAQISIKQAYGFIQFLDSESCHRALQAEQGGLIRGRKIHLEISKPQKSTRPGPNHSEFGRQQSLRRSRSPPDYSRGGPSNVRGSRNQGNDRNDRSYENKRGSFSDIREANGPRRRDDYRPPRSPSPRTSRNRDSGFRSKERTPDRFERRDRRRSRSPYSRDRRYRTPSPRARSGYEGESEHAYSRRARRDVPDVQILAADDVDMSFAYHVEDSFKTRGLRTNILVLSRIPVDVAIHRQMEEGVFAVVRLTRSQQYSRKVNLLIFDRSAGASKPRSLEYPDLDLHAAAEMTMQMHTARRAGVAQNYYQPNSGYPGPSLPNQFPQALAPTQPVMPALPQTNQIANLIQTLDGPALHSLLNTLQQTNSVPQVAMPSIAMASNASNAVDLATLLNNVHRQQNPLAAAQNLGPQPQAAANPFGVPLPAQAGNRLDPNLLALLVKGAANGGPTQGGQAAAGPHVQNIVNQLAKWKQ